MQAMLIDNYVPEFYKYTKYLYIETYQGDIMIIIKFYQALIFIKNSKSLTAI